jgi:hypothetical protein
VGELMAELLVYEHFIFHRYFLRSQHHEVLFPNQFTTKYPEGGDPILLDVLSDTEVPIYNLVHVTHNDEYRNIRKNPAMYELKACQKFGKDFYHDKGMPRCGSYKSIKDGAKFKRIGPDETVFPGFYSWWGIHPKRECTSKIAAEIEDMKDEGGIAYVPNYLKEEPESFYGNRGFFCSFKNVLGSYAQSRHTETANVVLRKGGTLRYTQEICYVIIVSISEDEHILREFDPLLPKSGPFRTNGLINRNGQIQNPEAIPTFSPEHVVTWFVDKSEGSESETYSYETTAFAFYFPTEGCSMSMRRREICSEVPFSHSEAFCSKKQWPPQGRQKRCPNTF